MAALSVTFGPSTQRSAAAAWLVRLGAAAACVVGAWLLQNRYKMKPRPTTTAKDDEEAVVGDRLVSLQAAAVRLLHTLQTPLPAMVVDLAAFDANAATFARMAASHGKTIRIATKSLRVPALIERVLQQHPGVFKGLMCYSAPEAAFWAARGQTDILIAYPTLQRCDVTAIFNATMANTGTRITMMVDCPAHVTALAATWAACDATGHARPTLPLCIDADMSYRPAAGALHLGAHRSPCRSVTDFIALYEAIAATPGVRLAAVMGYEAQVAGVPDHAGLFMTAFKSISTADVLSKRAAIAAFLQSRGHELDYFNGGGTGNAADICAKDGAITEVTLGSGLLQSHIFDGFASSTSAPALYYALQVTRTSGSDAEGKVVTCHSGGFIASGAVGVDKAPIAVYPRGLLPFPDEGFGEVQTPLRVCTPPSSAQEAQESRPGGIVLLRPAKAGEIAEQFVQYLLLEPADVDSSELQVTATVPTYRGLGHAFR